MIEPGIALPHRQSATVFPTSSFPDKLRVGKSWEGLVVFSKNWLGLLATGAVLFSNAAAQSLTGSSPGFHFFHKPGATMAEHNDALVDCSVATRGLVNGSDAMGAVTAATGGW